MESIKIKGKVVSVGDTMVKSDKFKKRELIVSTLGEYPQTFAIEFINDNEEKLDLITKDDVVEVDVNLRGRLWTNTQGDDKCFISLVGWKITKEK